MEFIREEHPGSTGHRRKVIVNKGDTPGVYEEHQEEFDVTDGFEGSQENIDETDEFEPTKPWPKVGRNEPCPCGSGKKYKKCCL